MRPGRRNSITDVEGLLVGNAQDDRLKSGVTTLVCERPTTAAVQILGGAPGTRETDLLEPHNTVEGVDALVLSGGSAFGLDAASGVQALLRERGRGFAVGQHRIPIVPAAILFDLENGGDKDWGRYAPYRDLGYTAAGAAASAFSLGSVGAGNGALTAGLKGGLGSASTTLENGVTVGALVAVNAVGATTFGDQGHFWAAPFEKNDEFGGRGWPAAMSARADAIPSKLHMPSALENTTIGVIATDAILTKAQAKRLAIAAHDGFSRAIWPSHTPMDGDLVFALATGSEERTMAELDPVAFFATAAATMARAIARGVFEAADAPSDVMPSWRQRYGSL